MTGRIIKFRAWQISNKQMWPTPESLMISGLGKIFFDQGCDGFGPLADPDYILMQFTGLQDKNGKDIYEGDIGQTTTATNPEGRIREIFWNKSLAGWDLRGGGAWLDAMNAGILVVIGNIHEHGDLLS